MASNKLIYALAFMLLIATTIAPLASEALTCNQVSSALAPCVNYLKNGGSPPPNCCKGVTNLNNAANSTPARRQACNCLKSLYKAGKGVQVSVASALPGKCKVNIAYSINPNIDCNTVK